MTTVAIHFIARRYHATPWDAHVNEGRIEWPPSPWRILRSLIAVGYAKHAWLDAPEPVAISLIEKLASAPPSFWLPPAVETHTRHYMPQGKIEKGSEKVAKVFDAHLRFTEPEPTLLVRYDVDLEPSETECLGRLVAGLAYLGRAEGWVEASLQEELDDGQVLPERWATARAGAALGGSPAKTASIRLLCSQPPETFRKWRREAAEAEAQIAEKSLRAANEEKNKKTTPAALKKARTKAAEPFPADFIDCLQLRTSVWQKQGWPRPPGSQWSDYNLPDKLFDSSLLVPPARVPEHDRKGCDTILLAIDGDGKRGTLRPSIKRGILLAEVLHQAAISKAGHHQTIGSVPEIIGRDANRKPLQNHQHAHWIPLDLQRKGSIDHVLVYAPGGFSRPAIRAVSAINHAYAKGIHDLGVNMVGQGQLEDFAEQLLRSGVRPEALRPFQRAQVWQSVRPLVLRQSIRKGNRRPENQLRSELQSRGFPDPVSVTFWPDQESSRRGLKGHVLRRKPNKPQPPFERSWGVTIEFAEPVSGPISLGYGSHFGLGLFEAQTS